MNEAELAKAGWVEASMDCGAAIANVAIVLTTKSTGVPIDFTGCTFLSQIKKSASLRDPLLASITVTTNTPATDGTLNLNSTGVTALPEGEYRFDIWCNEWQRFIIKGKLTIKGTVTRPS
jgi:hypothetical protein